MKKIIQFSIVFAMAFAVSIKSYSQVSGIYEEYGPISIGSGIRYKEVFNRQGVKVFARVEQSTDVNNNAWIYFRIENKNSKPAYIDANFKATGLPIKGPYGVKSTEGVVPGDRVNPNSYIEIRRPAENVRFVETLKVILHGVFLSGTNSSGISVEGN